MFLVFKDIKSSKSILSFILAALCIAIFLEGTFFNMRSYQTYYYEPIDLTKNLKIPSNLTEIEGTEGQYYAPSGSTVIFEFTDLNTKINNVYFDVFTTANNEPCPVTVKTSFTDEANELYLSTPAQAVNCEVDGTKYLYLVTSGISEKIKLTITGDATSFMIMGIYANAPKPFSFNIVRFLLTFLIVFIACLYN